MEVGAEQVPLVTPQRIDAGVGEPLRGHGRELEEGVETDAAALQRVPADAGTGQAGEAGRVAEAPGGVLEPAEAAEVADVEAEAAGGSGLELQELEPEAARDLRPADAERPPDGLAPLARGEDRDRLVLAAHREARRRAAADVAHRALEGELRVDRLVGVAIGEAAEERLAGKRRARPAWPKARPPTRSAAPPRSRRGDPCRAAPRRHSFSSMPAPPMRTTSPGRVADGAPRSSRPPGCRGGQLAG